MKPHLFRKIVKKGYIVVLNVTSTNSQVNIWNHGRGIGAAFVGDPQLGYIAGDTKCTVGEIGGTSKKIITVGAYTTKYTFQNIKGETMTSTDSLDRIANFSRIHLKNRGRLYFEINEAFGSECCEMLQEKGFSEIVLKKDINNKDRMIGCRLLH